MGIDHRIWTTEKALKKEKEIKDVKIDRNVGASLIRVPVQPPKKKKEKKKLKN